MNVVSRLFVLEIISLLLIFLSEFLAEMCAFFTIKSKFLIPLMLVSSPEKMY
jgi:hypothetical protein